MYEDFINLSWKSKLQHMYKLPRYYSEVTTIPFVTDKNIEVKFISNCLRLVSNKNISLCLTDYIYINLLFLRVNYKK